MIPKKLTIQGKIVRHGRQVGPKSSDVIYGRPLMVLKFIKFLYFLVFIGNYFEGFEQHLVQIDSVNIQLCFINFKIFEIKTVPVQMYQQKYLTTGFIYNDFEQQSSFSKVRSHFELLWYIGSVSVQGIIKPETKISIVHT